MTKHLEIDDLDKHIYFLLSLIKLLLISQNHNTHETFRIVSTYYYD